MSLSIRTANPSDIPTIGQLAEESWWPAYSSFISAEQISYMLKEMYSHESLTKQFSEGITFLLAESDGLAVGFAAFSETNTLEQVFKLHKLYLLPTEQGKGTGKLLIEEVGSRVKKLGGLILELNVNRGNKAVHFYKKQGFNIHQSLDIPYHTFVLIDYVMRKAL
jgi:GNAT superfamily N-acetyltransferase